jgi:hypothetical protein
MEIRTFDKNGNPEINFVTILSDFKVPDNLPIKIGNWQLKKFQAQNFELARIILDNLSGGSGFGPFPSQEKYIKELEENEVSYMPLKESEFRYLVLVPVKVGANIEKLIQAGRISDSDIWIDIINRGQNVLRYERSQIVSFFDRTRWHFDRLELGIDNFSEVLTLRESFDDDKFPSIVRAIKMFVDLDVVSEVSDLKHLGYFTIIESLLSHNPDPDDSNDTISKQLKRNLKSLEDRMPNRNKLWLGDFDSKNKDTVISKLYSYRSRIAHGGSDKEIKKLKEWFLNNKPIILDYNLRRRDNVDWMGWYLRNITKRILVQALKEPQLMIDLN